MAALFLFAYNVYDFEEEGNKHILGWILPRSRSPWNFTYETDPVRGNILSRSEYRNKGKRTESFQYDNMDRLTKINNPYGATSMKYHTNGNIEKKSDVGEYKYDGNRPHAVTDIVNPDSALINSTDYTLNYDENIHRPINIKRTGANIISLNLIRSSGFSYFNKTNNTI